MNERVNEPLLPEQVVIVKAPPHIVDSFLARHYLVAIACFPSGAHPFRSVALGTFRPIPLWTPWKHLLAGTLTGHSLWSSGYNPPPLWFSLHLTTVSTLQITLVPEHRQITLPAERLNPTSPDIQQPSARLLPRLSQTSTPSFNLYHPHLETHVAVCPTPYITQSLWTN